MEGVTEIAVFDSYPVNVYHLVKMPSQFLEIAAVFWVSPRICTPNPCRIPGVRGSSSLGGSPGHQVGRGDLVGILDRFGVRPTLNGHLGVGLRSPAGVGKVGGDPTPLYQEIRGL